MEHVLDGHELNEEGIMKFFVLPFNGIIISTIKIFMLLAIDDWEVRRFHQIRKLRFIGSKMLRSQLTVLDDRFTNFLKEVKVLFLWKFTGYFISQLVEFEEFVNESESTLDVAIEFIVGLLFECLIGVGILTFCSPKLVSENLNLLVQVADNLIVFLRITRIQRTAIGFFLHAVQGAHLIHKNLFDLCLQLGILIVLFTELRAQVFDLCVLLFHRLLISNSSIERSGILLKLSLLNLEFLEFFFPLRNDGRLSFGNFRKSLTLGEELLDVAGASEIIAVHFGLLSSIQTDLLELFLAEIGRFEWRLVVLGRL